MKVNDENSRIKPDPLVRNVDPRIQIRAKMSRIRNTCSGCRSLFGYGSLNPKKGLVPDSTTELKMIRKNSQFYITVYCGNKESDPRDPSLNIYKNARSGFA